jgi:hypothetical protein
MKKNITCIVALSLMLNICIAKDIISQNCKKMSNPKLVLNYLNGVAQTKTQAVFSAEKIEIILKSSQGAGLAGITQENICIVNTYNQTNGYYRDIIELVGQKLNEANDEYGTQFSEEDLSKYIMSRAEFIRNGLSAFSSLPHLTVPVKIFSSLLSEIVIDEGKAIQPVVQASHIETVNKVMVDIEGLISNVNLPIVLVSHSQGNMFANELVSQLRSVGTDETKKFMTNRFANLQVATPVKSILAPINDYYTHQDDILINTLKESIGGSFDIKDANLRYFPARLHFFSDPNDVGEAVTNLKNFRIFEDLHGFDEHYISDTSYGTEYSALWDSVLYEHPYVEKIYGQAGQAQIFLYNKIQYDKYKNTASGTITNITTNTSMKKMSDIFYTKLNDLAKQVVCTPDSVSGGTIESLGFEVRPVYSPVGSIYTKLGSTKDILSYEVGKRDESGNFTTEGVDQKDFTIHMHLNHSTGYVKVANAGEVFKPEYKAYFSSDNNHNNLTIRVIYRGNKDSTGNETALTSCYSTTYFATGALGSLRLDHWGVTTKLSATPSRFNTVDVVSHKLFTARFSDPLGGAKRQWWLSELDESSFQEIYSWRTKNATIPEGLTLLNPGEKASEYEFSVTSNVNKVVILESCTPIRCSHQVQSIALPDFVKGSGGALGEVAKITIINKVPAYPFYDAHYEATLVGGQIYGPSWYGGDANGTTAYLNQIKGRGPFFKDHGSLSYYSFNSIVGCSTESGSAESLRGITLQSGTAIEGVWEGGSTEKNSYHDVTKVNVIYNMTLKFGEATDFFGNIVSNDIVDFSHSGDFVACDRPE